MYKAAVRPIMTQSAEKKTTNNDQAILRITKDPPLTDIHKKTKNDEPII